MQALKWKTNGLTQIKMLIQNRNELYWPQINELDSGVKLLLIKHIFKENIQKYTYKDDKAENHIQPILNIYNIG